MKRSQGVLGWILLVLFTVIGTLALVMFLQERIRARGPVQVETGWALPASATDIVSVGNGWYEFTYKGQRFLYYRYYEHQSAQSAIVRIDDER